MVYSDYEAEAVLNIGIALSKEKDRNKLLDMILTKSMELANCDAGTLYMNQDNALHFKIMKTISMGVDKGRDGAEIDLPPVPMKKENICAYTAIHKNPINIENVYMDTTFDFSGPMNYDKMTGYHTVSLLTVPLINQGDEVVGVIQLINSLDEEGNPCPFEKRIERVIFALSAQAAIAVSNIRYISEMKEQMWSFTEAMAEAIDNRTPYNANHVRKVAEYAGRIADYYNELYEKGEEEEYFNENRKEQLVMSALLHDIGKLIIPTKVMNKPSRLGSLIDDITQRFLLLEAKYKIAWLEHKITDIQYNDKIDELQRIKEVIGEIDYAGFVREELMAEMKSYFSLQYDLEQECIPYFTEKEQECLSIQKGTLTTEERRIMESHVDMTERILEKVHFNSYFRDCAKWAVQHHERLNGTGYPKGITEKELSVEARILAVADIGDALMASDRPYKKPLSREKVFEILRSMAEEGGIDGKIVDYMEACI